MLAKGIVHVACEDEPLHAACQLALELCLLELGSGGFRVSLPTVLDDWSDLLCESDVSTDGMSMHRPLAVL